MATPAQRTALMNTVAGLLTDGGANTAADARAAANAIIAMLPDITGLQNANDVSSAITSALTSYRTSAQITTQITNAVNGFILATAVEEYAKTGTSTRIPEGRVASEIARVSQLPNTRSGTGTNEPANTVGRNGDFYLRYQTGRITVYGKQAGAWGYPVQLRFVRQWRKRDAWRGRTARRYKCAVV